MHYLERLKQINKPQADTKPVLRKVPGYISYFLGYRDAKVKPLVSKVPEWARLIQVLLVTFCAITTSEAINKYGYPFKKWHTPPMLPSFGAASILMYNAVSAPLAQPRGAIGGTMIAAFLAVVIMKFFMTHEGNEPYLWYGAALSCALTSVVMSITGTVFPPAGATSVVPFLDADFRELGWKYLVVTLCSTAVFLAFALLFDNILMRYPHIWWTPTPRKMITILPTNYEANVPVDDDFMMHVQALQKYLN